MRSRRPATVEEAAALVRDAREPLRPRGGATKWAWAGDAGGEALDTTGLDRIVSHVPGDFTAVLEAGVRLADAQATFARAGQMLALDPPAGAGTTIGGVLATADSGPLRHRYGAPRDLVLGMTVVSCDGAISRSGGTVIKNVAGYDLGKLHCGAFGSLGLIVRAALRLHPLPSATATARLTSDDPDVLTGHALDLAGRPLEADCLDVAWDGRRGAVLVRFSGDGAAGRAAAIGELVEDDDALWESQRAGQRSEDGVVLRVSGRPGDLPRVLRAGGPEAAVVSRAALGLSWLRLPADAALVRRVREALAPRACTVLDAPPGFGASRLPRIDPGALALMRRVKARLDPRGTFPDVLPA